MHSNGPWPRIGDVETRCVLAALASTPGVGSASIARLRSESERSGIRLRDLISRPARTLRGLGVSAVAAAAILRIPGAADLGQHLLSRLAARGVSGFFPGDHEYPIRIAAPLGIHAPQVCFVLGDASLMRAPGIAIVGSRRPSRRCAEAARCLARQFAAAGLAVISGGARGIDTLAHEGAVETGATVVCPPVGLLRFKPPVRPAPTRCCVMGQFAPFAGWQNAQALLRNRTIVALSDAVVAFDPRDCGGTWHSSRQALAMSRPLFVASECASPELARGVAHLVSHGAVRLDLTAMPDAAALTALITEHRGRPRPVQSSLLLTPPHQTGPSA
jgi:DNA processing protein